MLISKIEHVCYVTLLALNIYISSSNIQVLIRLTGATVIHMSESNCNEQKVIAVGRIRTYAGRPQVISNHSP